MASPGFVGNSEATHHLPTPPGSSVAASQHASPLPQPRRRPLKPGGPKESELIRYLDHGVNQIQKRVDNRLTNHRTQPVLGEEGGYRAFWEAARDLDGLVDVVWVSGSPNLQVPYLLNLAVLTADYLPLFAASARSTQAMFRLLSKLDYAFSSLLTGQDSATSEQLPGFEAGRTISTTDKVRLKGIVDRTRLIVVRVTSEESMTADDDTNGFGEAMDTDMEEAAGLPDEGRQGTVVFQGFEHNGEDEADEEWEERNVGAVYQSTIGDLGDVLGGPPIGIITDDPTPNGSEQQRRRQGSVEPKDEVAL